MIEMYSATHSGRFANNTETSRKQGNPEAGFDKIFRDAKPEPTESGAVKDSQSDDSTDKAMIVSGTEMVMYSFFGKKTVIGGNSGRVVNFEI